jgi:antitoxin YefM
METVTYTEASKNLVKTMEKVYDDHAPVVSNRQKADTIDLLSLEDYHSFEI